MTKFQSYITGYSLLLIGVGLSIFGWVCHVEEAIPFGGLCFGSGLGALKIPRPSDAAK